MTTPPAPATNPIYDFTGQVALIAGARARCFLGLPP